MSVKLFHGDCLELMARIPPQSVDMVLCDPPYGTTNCEWDAVIPFEPMWEHYKRICKPNAAIVIFSQMPFAVDLTNSNRKMFLYEWIWEKTMRVGFLNAKKMPLRLHENILVFYDSLPTYNPQKTTTDKKNVKNRTPHASRFGAYGKINRSEYTDDGTRYPTSVLTFPNANYKSAHPTQKPVALLEYLIKTYTNEGETVLDNCMGSGSTGVACVNTNRAFIGIEKDERYCEIAERRISDAWRKKAAGKKPAENP